MSFITGLMLIDAPASALNNSNQKIPNSREDNSVAVKFIHSRAGDFPYVSAQAVRAWIRNGLETSAEWKSSPVYRDEKVSYTAGDPIEYWDDDLFGYMRAPGENLEARLADPSYQSLTPLDVEKDKKSGKQKEQAITRIAPFRVSTFVSVAPVYITADFGTMVRQQTGSAVYPDGPDPVPYEHQFYRTTLQGLISLDLRRVGRFTYRDKSGYRNLDEVRKQKAKEGGLEHLTDQMAYRLPIPKRMARVKALVIALAQLEGGAKQAVHYTDVSPDLVLLAATTGGNNIFGHVVRGNARGLPELNTDALEEAIRVNATDLLSPVYIGWVKGYLDDERAKLEEWMKPSDLSIAKSDEDRERMQAHDAIVDRIKLLHPREAFQSLADSLDEKWFE